MEKHKIDVDIKLLECKEHIKRLKSRFKILPADVKEIIDDLVKTIIEVIDIVKR